MKTRVWGIIVITAAIVGCRSTTAVLSPYDRFGRHMDAREFHEAFRLWPEAYEELKEIPEGAAGCAYNTLIMATTGVGQHDWVAILTDREISIELRRELLHAIGEDMVETEAAGDE